MNPHPLADLIPSRNTFSLEGAATYETAAAILEQAYSPAGSFVGAFCLNSDNAPTWARQIAEYDRDQFRGEAPGIKRFSETPTARLNLANDGAGQCMANWRHALEAWTRNGSSGPKPFTRYQDYGSCTDAERAERFDCMLGTRATLATVTPREKFLAPAAWYAYAERGFCGDGWTLLGVASATYRIGLAFCRPTGGIDFGDDDTNERTVARTWCRSGVPDALAAQTARENPVRPGSITEFDADTRALRALFAAGGTLATGGTFTSGGPKPFTPGSVGPHAQGAIGADDSDDYRRFALDTIGFRLPNDDFAVVLNQTWGPNWSGECSSRYWPSWWGPKPEGAWVTTAKTLLRKFAGDMVAYLPDFTGLADPNPSPAPPPSPTPNPPAPPADDRPRVELSIVGRDGRRFDYIGAPKPNF